MKTIIALLALTAVLVHTPAILVRRVSLPQPKVIVFKKGTTKFLRFF